jgi:hypothetical protein
MNMWVIGIFVSIIYDLSDALLSSLGMQLIV